MLFSSSINSVDCYSFKGLHMTKVKVSDFLQTFNDGVALLKVSKDGKEFGDKFYKASYYNIDDTQPPFITNTVTDATLSISCINSVKKLGAFAKTKLEQLDKFVSDVTATVKAKKVLDTKTVLASIDELPEDIKLSFINPTTIKSGDKLEIKGLLDIDFT